MSFLERLAAWRGPRIWGRGQAEGAKHPSIGRWTYQAVEFLNSNREPRKSAAFASFPYTGPTLLVRRVVPLLLAGALLYGGCGASGAAATPAYPLYSQREAELFDDLVHPRIVGVSYDAPSLPARNDPALFERAQTSDTVVRARIDSVTGAAKGARFELGLRVVEVLAGAASPASGIVLKLDATSRSFGMVRAVEGRIGGRAVIAFMRTYTNENGEIAVHFHLLPDELATSAAVREALSLDRVAPIDGGVAKPGPK